MIVGLSQPARAGKAAIQGESLPRCELNGETLPAGSELGSHPDWMLWQLADSAFPTGGFAHSSGLEAAWRYGEVSDRVELEYFIEASLIQLGHGSLPFMTAAYHDPPRMIELDLLCESFTLNHVANRSSRSQGRALLASAQRIFGLPGLPAPHQTRTRQSLCGHLAPVFGVVTRSLDVGFAAACRLFLFLHVRGLVASAVRLGIVGPLEGQALLRAFGPRTEVILQRCQNLTLDEIAQVSPLLDLWQGAHDRLYSRLFQT